MCWRGRGGGGEGGEEEALAARQQQRDNGRLEGRNSSRAIPRRCGVTKVKRIVSVFIVLIADHRDCSPRDGNEWLIALGGRVSFFVTAWHKARA
ncbi:hypothetical protein RB195_008657 [Necator americanus]|uniref:Uncharacterized protein n=1 Tax=Necator americanus TaxID=51031 RepID=A0ABR1CPN4_NECAM